MDIMHNRRKLFLIEGSIFIILGMLAVALPGISTLSVELFLGWLLFFSGSVQLYRTITTSHLSGFWGSLLASSLSIIFGLLLAFFPIAGIISLTLLLTFFFIADGVAKLIFGFQFTSSRRWIWLIVSGLLSLAIAYIIWSGWPGTAFWVLGLLVGINMIFFGISLIFLGLDMPKQTTP